MIDSRVVLVARCALAATIAFVLIRPLYRVPLECSRQVALYKAATLAATGARDQPMGLEQARRNLRGLLAVERQCPPDVDLSMMAGANAMVLDRPELAIASYQRALAVEGRPEIYLSLGLAQLAAERRTEALENLTLAARFNPYVLKRMTEPVAADVRERLAGSPPEPR